MDVTTLYNVCSVMWGAQYHGGVQYHGGYHDACGDILSTVGEVQYCGDIMIYVGDILITVRCSVLWGIS